ncbi:type II CRISPR RNA-guided endonuclease Cas9 [Hydrotalea sp.]|uniref:type II CRISPR RNA-guided endonuclease Cas9 n=1 Tax=Hydrotalea sp. TaxID=2881279 RepID=UPI003D0D6F05
MSENNILALDLGSNSIGAVIRNIDEDTQFKKATVITFQTGVGKDKENKYTISLAANRTSKRCIRRLYQSRKYKLWAVLEALIKDKNKLYCPINENSLKRWKYYNKEQAHQGNGGRKYPVNDILFNNWIKLDFNNDNLPDYTSPYQLRHELVTVKLDFSKEVNRYKLGRALYHIAQHRGFKSSKIVNDKDDEKENSDVENLDNIGAESKKQSNFIKELEKIGFSYNPENETVGSLFARVETKGIHHPDRKTEGIRIRKNLHQYVTRKMLIKEVKQIFDFQQLEFNEIFDEKNSKIPIAYSPIFRQRPLRSQKGLVGYCTLESQKIFDKKKGREVFVGKKRCPISRPEFEEFRALSFINNIAYREKDNQDNEWQFLPPEMRKGLYQEKFLVQKDFEFHAIAKWIKQKNKHDNWELNYNSKTNVSACTITSHLKRIFGDDWNMPVTRTDRKGKAYSAPFYEDIWHVLFESDDQDFIEDYGKSKLNLSDEKIQQLIALWYAMPVGYAQLSLKAINNILPFLREGYIYTDAVLLGKVPEILGIEIWEENKHFIAESLKKLVIEKNREEKRILNIVNNLIAKYKARPKGNERFADNDTNYIVGSRDFKLPIGSIERDDVQIEKAAEEGFGRETWKKFSEEEKAKYINQITESYQKFFKSSDRDFYKLPRLGDAMKVFLADKFRDLLYCQNSFKKIENGETKCNCEKCKRINKLYHPSMIAIYPQAREEYYKYNGITKNMVMLGSPKTGAFKNPMAMRTLHELKKLVNYYIVTGQVNEETRVVVEIGRELNDTNKRWAIEKYQEIRRKENQEFAAAILELIKDPEAKGSLANPYSDSDIDKFRLWYEMIESPEGFEKNGKFTATKDDRTTKESRGNLKKKHFGEDTDSNGDEFYEFSENHFENVKKEIWLKLKKAKDKVIDKYRLWKEQQCFCMYTGHPISITDLFNENLIDIEHTIPRSISFDNSLANKTVCFFDYNRKIKKNQIPADLPNYNEIVARLEKWKQKVKDLEMRVEFWKGKSKRATTIEYKNIAIREKHLWQFELEYWRNKVERFTMKEVKPGFKNSQLKDTQIISKYALHYLKTYFNQVEVQKGEVTAQFREIFDIQETRTEKDRSKHSHHAKDAMILSVIPSAAIRDRMLELWYAIKEKELLLKSDTEPNKAALQEEIKNLNEELNDYKSRLKPKGFNNTINELDKIILNNNISRNRSVIPASKKIRIRGKNFVAKGDAIRGELHLATMYGKIQMVERENDIPVRDENGNWKFLEGDDAFKTVLRKEVDKNLNIDTIVDPPIKKIIKAQMRERTLAATLAEDGGLYMLNKEGKRVHKIRHIRCFESSVTNPIQVRKQDIFSNKEHKNYYWAKNGENILCAFYQKSIKDKKGNEKIDRELEIISLMEVAKFVQSGEIKNLNDLEIYRTDKKTGEVIIDENGNKEKPFAILKPGMKTIFYDNNLEELFKAENETENDYLKRISYRTYILVKFSGGRITFKHHLESRNDDQLKKAYPKNKYGVAGTSGITKNVIDALTENELNNFEPWPKLLYTRDWLNMAIEGKHFEMMPDGSIVWLKNKNE